MQPCDIERIWQAEHERHAREQGLKLAVCLALGLLAGIGLLAWWVK